jgi:hypothetical protein
LGVLQVPPRAYFCLRRPPDLAFANRTSCWYSEASEAVYFDVTGNATPDSAPLGSINRARWPAEAASRKARMRTNSRGEPQTSSGETAASGG